MKKRRLCRAWQHLAQSLTSRSDAGFPLDVRARAVLTLMNRHCGNAAAPGTAREPQCSSVPGGTGTGRRKTAVDTDRSGHTAIDEG